MATYYNLDVIRGKDITPPSNILLRYPLTYGTWPPISSCIRRRVETPVRITSKM